jgi:hypothetical protein
MKYFKLSFIVFVFANALLSSAQVYNQDIEKAINIEALQHPYLHLTEHEKLALIERLKNNPVTFPIYILLLKGKSLNFEDSGSETQIGNTHLINKLACETKSKDAVWYRKVFLC